MEIHILLAGVQIGPFSERQVREYLKDGLISPYDLAKYDGMRDWEAVGTVLANLPPPELVPEPLSAPAPMTAVPEPELLPQSTAPKQVRTRLTAPLPLPRSAEAKAKADVWTQLPAPEPVVPETPTPAPIREPDGAPEIAAKSHDAVSPRPAGGIAEKGEPDAAPAPEPLPKVDPPALPPAPSPVEPPATPAAQVNPPPPSTATPPPDVAFPSIGAKVKRKPAKIVIQQILPLSGPPATSHQPEQESATKKTTGKAPIRLTPSAAAKPLEKNIFEAPLAPAAPVVTNNSASAANGPLVTNLRSLPSPPDKHSQGRRPHRRSQPILLYATGIVLLLVAIPLCALRMLSSVPSKSSEPVPAPVTAEVKPVVADTPVIAPPSADHPQTAGDYCARGQERQTKGDLEGALADFDQAIKLDPNFVPGYYRRGLARQAKSDWDGAQKDFDQTLSLDPRHADAFSNRAFVKQAKNDFDGAIADYTQALLINPKIAIAFYNRGLIKSQRGDLGGAILDYNHALEIDPGMAVAYYNRGNAKSGTANLDGAIADYTEAIRVNPKIALAYCHRGFARQAKGDVDGALEDYNQALGLDAKLAVAYYNRGLIREQKNDLDGAIDDSTKALEFDPKDAQSYCNRGLARLGKGDLKGARSDLKAFCDLQPHDSDEDYARLYLWTIAMQLDAKEHADQDLSDAFYGDWSSTPEELASKIAKFLFGHLSEANLIAAATSPDPAQQDGLQCKAWYFAGMKRLLTGDKPTAIAHFKKALATGKKEFCEYIFAQAKLKELEPDVKPALEAKPDKDSATTLP